MPDTIQVRELPLHDGAASAEEMADGVVYPVCDKMGESSLQQFVNMWLVMLLRSYFAAAGRQAFVGSNQFFYYKRGDPRSAVSPDLYVIDGEDRSPTSVPSWKVWEHEGKVPALVLEVVSDEYRKDYADQLLERYQQLGVRELVRYDPGHGDRSGRSLLTHFVRDENGRLIARPTLHDRVQSVVFGFWLVLQSDKRIRLGLGPHGEALWPTDSEKSTAEAAARKEAEAARELEAAARKAAEVARDAAEAAREAEAAAREAEAAARAVAEAEVERMRAELARLRRG
jgi:Uma2 family endonuclease